MQKSGYERGYFNTFIHSIESVLDLMKSKNLTSSIPSKLDLIVLPNIITGKKFNGVVLFNESDFINTEMYVISSHQQQIIELKTAKILFEAFLDFQIGIM